MKLKIGDRVKITAGVFKGETGAIASIGPNAVCIIPHGPWFKNNLIVDPDNLCLLDVGNNKDPELGIDLNSSTAAEVEEALKNWAESFGYYEDNQSLSVAGSTNNCDHNWVVYNGLFESYEYCDKCDHKRDNHS